jgi:hypothetical protein
MGESKDISALQTFSVIHLLSPSFELNLFYLLQQLLLVPALCLIEPQKVHLMAPLAPPASSHGHHQLHQNQ